MSYVHNGSQTFITGEVFWNESS